MKHVHVHTHRRFLSFCVFGWVEFKKEYNYSLGQGLELKVKVLVTQLCLALCNPMGCSPPGSSIHGILQARILDWVVISSSRGSF